jgi:hypothetical protein
MFGILPNGIIEIRHNKSMYNLCDEVSGTVSLKMNKTIDAESFVIQLLGQKVKISEEDTEIEKVFEMNIILDNKKQYQKGSYNSYSFMMKLPPTIGVVKPKNKVISTVIKLFQPKYEWFLTARLMKSGIFDLRKKVRIKVNC